MSFVRDSQKQFIYEFYLRSTINELLVFSNVDVTKHWYKTKKKNIDIYKFFESNEILHITIGPEGQWLNIDEY